MNNFFGAAADLHSAWIDAYTMFYVNDKERVGEREKNETNSFASFHVIPLSNSKINKFTSQHEKNYFRLCVWFSREITLQRELMNLQF